MNKFVEALPPHLREGLAPLDPSSAILWRERHNIAVGGAGVQIPAGEWGWNPTESALNAHLYFKVVS